MWDAYGSFRTIGISLLVRLCVDGNRFGTGSSDVIQFGRFRSWNLSSAGQFYRCISCLRRFAFRSSLHRIFSTNELAALRAFPCGRFSACYFCGIFGSPKTFPKVRRQSVIEGSHKQSQDCRKKIPQVARAICG